MPNKILDNQDIFDYIKNQKWFLGIRADESLLFYSAKTGGYKYIGEEYGIKFSETLLIPGKNDYPIRVFNLRQAKDFHAVSDKKIIRNPKILSSYIERDDLIYRKINTEGKRLITALKRDDFDGSLELFSKIISLYEISSAHFIIIFSLGLKLAENIVKLKDAENIEKRHDTWRNSVAFKEEAMGENLFRFFKYILAKKRIKLDPLLLMKFITVNEIRAWLKEELSDDEIKNKITFRKKHGFVYLNLRGVKNEIIDDPVTIKKIRKYFLKLESKPQKFKRIKKIIGQVVCCPAPGLVKGKVIVIKDKSWLRSKGLMISGKILTSVQTTPHFIPYIKKAKAIITDEGGLTCHAAIVSREFGIPCVVGTKIATKILKDNDSIEVDMASGLIKIKLAS